MASSPSPPASCSPILLGKGVLREELASRGVVLADANKLKDKTTTVYRIKTKENQQMMVQFGKSMKEWVNASIISFKDREDESKTRKMCFVNVEQDEALMPELQSLIREIGQRLFDGREAYWGGRIKDSMDFEEFMERCSALVKTNNVSGCQEAILKCPDSVARFWHVSNIEEGEDGTFSFKRRPVVRMASSSRQFLGLIACNVHAYTGWNKGPTWGVYLNVRDACLQPQDRKVVSAASEKVTIAFGAEVDMTTVSEEKMVLDQDGDHEATQDELQEIEDERRTLSEDRKRRSGNAPGFSPSAKQLRKK